METRLKNIVKFEAVPAGDSVSKPHMLNLGSAMVIPDQLQESTAGDFTVEADDTNITVTNKGTSAEDIEVYAERWFAADRQFGMGNSGINFGTELITRPWQHTAPGGEEQVVTRLVWRPGAVGDDAGGFNVYPQATFNEVHTAARRIADHQGGVIIDFDARFAGLGSPSGPAMEVNALGGGAAWDMANITWGATWDGFGNNPLQVAPTVMFAPDCLIDNMTNFAFDFGFLYQRSVAQGGGAAPVFRGIFEFSGTHVEAYNDDAAAVPLFEAAGGFMLIVLHQGNVGTFGVAQTSAAPLIDGKDSFFLFAYEGIEGTIADNVFKNDAGGFFFINDPPANGSHQWQQPAIASAQGSDQSNQHGDRSRRMTAVLDAAATAKYNQIILVDSSGGAFALQFPTAVNAVGETITVVDVGGGANAATMTPDGGDTVDSDTVSAGERKTYAPDGAGTWRHIA